MVNGEDIDLFINMVYSGHLFFRLFDEQLPEQKCSLEVDDDWIRTWLLW